MAKAIVMIRLKEQVSDPSGRTVLKRLNSLGFNEVKDARIGKIIELEFSTNDMETVKKRTEEMCAKLLSSSVTEEAQIVSIIDT